MNKLKIVVLSSLLGIASFAHAQKIALKNNLLYDVTATPNLALEASIGRKTTLELGVGVNPFTFSDNKKFKHWLVQP